MDALATTASVHGLTADDRVMDSVADAVRDASKSATVQAAALQNAISDTGLVRSVSRVTYTGAYALSFGIVYPAMFLARWLPQPLVDGFEDGARAAMDSLSAR